MTESGERPRYSLVVPVYRSAELLPELVRRIEAFFAEHPSSYELILVNDASPDDSWAVLERLQDEHDHLVCIDLMRNAGQHSAVFCGFEHARGDWVITLDDDLQNPPEELIHLMRKADEGHDVVFGRFRQKMHGAVRKLGSRVVGYLNRKLFGKPDDLVLTNFRIIRREVVEAACDYRTAFPYIPGLLLMCGRSFANVEVEHHARPVGDSNYGVLQIARLLWRLTISYSAFPLRLVCGAGGILAVLSFLFGAYHFVRALLSGTSMPGWPTVVVLLSVYQGFVLLILAVLGEFLVRVSNDVSRQRSYRVRRILR